MSVQEHLDALVWAAAVDSSVSEEEASEIRAHAEALVASGDSAVPKQLSARLDELVAKAAVAAAGGDGAASTLRALLRDLMIGDEDGADVPGAAGSSAASDGAGDDPQGPDDDLLAVFIASGTEAVLEIETAILTLEDSPSPAARQEAIESLKRDIHTLKGECGVLSLHIAQSVWHEAESLIEEALDSARAIPTEPLMDVLDWHRQHLALLSADGNSSPPDHAAVMSALQNSRAESEPAREEEVEQEGSGGTVEFSAELLEDETVPDFVTEARQHLEESEAALFELEEDPKASESIDKIFRAFHTIKGVAGFLNITPVTDLAHVVETLLDRFRDSDIEFTSAHADIVLESKDMMDRLFGALLGAEGPPEAGLAKLVSHVSKVAEDPTSAQHLGPRVIQEALASAGIKNDEDLAEATRDPGKATGQLGEILVAKGALTEEQLKDALQRQEELRAKGQQIRLGEMLVLLGAVNDSQLEAALEIQGKKSSLGRLLEAEVAPKVEEPEKAPTKEPKKKAKYDSTIRVSTQRLDGLVDMVGELVIAQQMVVQGTEALASAEGDSLLRNLAHLGKITRDLQEASMSLRMVTFQSTFQKMHRLVRDVASRAGKSIRLEIQGADTEVDRNVVDKISDPLVHLVRNAIDHGVETPAERESVGKTAQGHVTLSARHQGGAIVISLKDDGRGLDRDKILAKAREKGLIPPDREASEMSDGAIYKLIFEPGFSTAAAVTDISGRGVGMDVVKRNIEAMRGKVEIFSERGKGAEFQIQLPLTLAIIDAMIVRSTSQRYVIPTLSIVQSFRPDAKQLHAIRGASPVVEVRGQLVPLHRLDQILDGYSDHEGDADTATLVLVEGMGRRVCLVIDEIIGQQQVVIKKLGPCTPPARVISGGAILGDGRVALIVDIEGILAETESVALC